MNKLVRIAITAMCLMLAGGLTLQAVTDTEAPKIVITTPVDGGSYFLNQPVLAAWEVTDPEPSSGIQFVAATVVSGRPIDTHLVGPKMFEVVARDNNGNQAAKSLQYFIVYKVEALAPVAQAAFDDNDPKSDPSFTSQSGQPVLFRFKASDFFDKIVGSISGIISVINAETHVVVPIEKGVIGELRLDEKSGVYQYSLSTTGIAAGHYVVYIQFNDQKTIYRFNLILQ